MQKILFICSQNKLRSPTGETVFTDYSGVETRSAGLNHNAHVPLGAEDVEWADIIFVMEQTHKKKLRKRYKEHINKQRIICLGIPDIYEYMDVELIAILKRDVPKFLDVNSVMTSASEFATEH